MLGIQHAPLGQTQDYAVSFYASSTGQLALLQLLFSQEREKMVKELLKINKQNLNVRPSDPCCKRLVTTIDIKYRNFFVG